ncbi:hypothetical protein CAL14_08315 [Bordetella genomosp. 9]|uniref:hypothetical protein n=1 Tax=Bordetella genomosp. 9 TaxID=1416803 RepID=UPI000A295604|nr:hypothetical protein [Bordetella genomosp. 9]ARP90287.1 hypothetical protein CAL14_08315 [Bordetella genomosp. 9]
MIADDTILLTGLHGDDYPACVAFDDFDDTGVPATGFMQITDDDGQRHTIRQLSYQEVAMYWADLEKLRADAEADDLIDQRRAA